MTSRDVLRDLNRDVTTSKPSIVSNVRAFWGWSSNDVTRAMMVDDWIAGQLDGSRRSRKSWRGLVSVRDKEKRPEQDLHSCISLVRIELVKEDVKVKFPGSDRVFV